MQGKFDMPHKQDNKVVRLLINKEVRPVIDTGGLFVYKFNLISLPIL